MYALLYFLHIPMYSFGGNRCIYLCCSQVGVSEHTAHRFNRYTCRKRDKRCKGVSCHVKGQRSFHTDISLYIVHAIEDNVGGWNVKDKACPYPSITIYDSLRRGKHLYTIRSFGFHSPALDAEFAFFQNDVFLPKITDVGDCQPRKAGEDEQITDNAVVLPFNLQVDDVLKFFLRNASRFAFWSLVTVTQERIEVQHTFLYRYTDNGLQSRQGTRYAAAFQSAFDGEIILEALDKCFVQL